MAPQTTVHHLALALALALLFTAIAVRASLEADAVSPTAAAPRGASQWAAFLRARCATTLYPAVCYDSLQPYAATFQTSRVRLARAATDVVAARLRAFSALLKDLVHRDTGTDGVVAGPSRRVAAALRDCASTISSAASLAGRSSAELGRLDAATAAGSSREPSTAGGRQARWEVSNAQTWLSAAMTNEGTCSDGFVEAGKAAASSTAGKEAVAGVASVSQFTSNALALVNGIPL